MKMLVKTTCSVLFLVFATTALAERQKRSFDLYQTIIERQMFGPLPPGFDPTKSPNEVQKSTAASEKQLTQEQAKLQSAIHFSVINVTSEGLTEVGFTDNTDPKAPKHYFLKVGESRDGWEVKEADPENATMTIAKGEIEVSLTLGGNSAKDGAATKSSSVQPAGGIPATGFGSSSLLSGGSLRARRLQRQQKAEAEKAKADAAAAEKEAERQERAEEERVQREQERAEQRQQLQAIQEELKRVREEKAKSAAQNSEEGGGDAED